MTTRTLVILRHAKAANPEFAADRDRPLTPRGHADAAAAGAWLDHSGLAPDMVLCSSSRRTRETWHAAALGLSTGPQVRYQDQIYGASLKALLATVRSAGTDAATVLLIGHNPGLSELSATLDPDLADAEGLRTCGIAVHTLDGDWTDFGPGAAALTASHTARAESDR